MRVLHCISGLSVASGGPSRCVPALCAGLAALGNDVTLVAGECRPGEETAPVASSVHTVLLPVQWPRKVGRSPAMREWLAMWAGGFHVLHSNGLWMWPAKYLSMAARQQNAPLVVTPHGLLEPWCLRHHRLRKKVAWHLWAKKMLAQAACLHATCEAEVQSIRRVGLGNPVAVIPNGVDLAEFERTAAAGPPADQLDVPDDRRLALFLSRVHPKKGLLNLVRAWAALDGCAEDWHLVVVGPDEAGHRAEVEAAARREGVAARVSFPGPVYGESKAALMAHAEVFVLPTFSENFGIVVAESLAAGTPVVTTTGAPWKELETNGCGWWIEIGVEPLVEALEDALGRSPADLRRMGERGRRLVEEKYTWDRIAEQMIEVYEWLLGGTTRPACVRV